MFAGWPSLPSYESWSATCDTLHAHTQVLGKLSVELAPPNADIAATSDTIAIRTTSADPFRNVLKKPLLRCGTPGEPYCPAA